MLLRFAYGLTTPALCVVVCLALPAFRKPADVGNSSDRERQLTQYRNLGKAFYENPTTQAEAVSTFKKALDLAPNSVREQLNYGLALLRNAKNEEAVAILEKVQKEDPSLPHTWFNLGIYYKREGQFDRALEQLQQMSKLVPGEPITHYNLGAIYKLQNKPELSRKEFETARDLDPSLAAPHFQLFNLYRQAGRMEDAQRELRLFNERKKAQENDAIPKEDIEWCQYAEIYEPLAPEDDVSKKPARFSFAARRIGELVGAGKGMVVIDAFARGTADLLVYSNSAVALYKNGSEKVAGTGLEALKDVAAIIPGDLNNDGFVDLCVLTSAGAVLYDNHGGKFTRASSDLPKGEFHSAVWIDFDHDYDLDLMLLGKQSLLLRNEGNAGFVPHPFPFAEGEALSGVPFRLIPDTKAKDLVISYRDRPATLYLDQLTAEYKSQPLPQVPAGASDLHSLDVDNDGNLDLAYTASNAVQIARNERTKFATPVRVGPAPGVWSDFVDRGFADYAGGSGIFQNTGLLHFAEAAAVTGLPAGIEAWASADFNSDGLPDLAVVTTAGELDLITNQSPERNRWARVKIDGVKNLKLPLASEIEIKAGSSYQKKVYEGVPLLFGLGSRQSIDTVRITWPNGLIQNEMNQGTNKTLDFKEAQRLSGSCPLIFTWNGKEFQYITDVLGVAPLGAMSGDGQFFPTDHTEYISLSGSSLAPRKDANGKQAFEIHLTEELSEVSYFDQVQLIAVDHPADTEIYSNEKWKSPPFPEFRLYGLQHRIYPVAARSEHGDVLERLLHTDKRYVDDFEHNYIGVAGRHTLDLDFGKAAHDNKAFLVLNGWVDWADGSTFLQQAQAKNDLTPPYLQVKNKTGKWVTVIEDMGMPSGKPKTISVDLTGKFLSDSREIRIVTNMCVYWDEIYLGESAAPPPVQMTTFTPETSSVEFRGFSPSHIHPERKQPEYFEYGNPTTTSYWNPTPGYYTRYGDTTELTHAIDDRLVIMGSGDMLSLRFDDIALPVVRPGWRRDYLLRVEGWAKDRDANTAYSQTVGPLPFHAMSRYPYPSSEHYPDDALHQRYVKEYLTRPALELIQPLVPTKRREASSASDGPLSRNQ
jgi:tetratricopeptide (TPR) repeat protein